MNVDGLAQRHAELRRTAHNFLQVVPVEAPVGFQTQFPARLRLAGGEQEITVRSAWTLFVQSLAGGSWDPSGVEEPL